jgi:hypothetical protein
MCSLTSDALTQVDLYASKAVAVAMKLVLMWNKEQGRDW